MSFNSQMHRLYQKRGSHMILSRSIYTDNQFKMAQLRPYDPPKTNFAFQLRPENFIRKEVSEDRQVRLIDKAKEYFNKFQLKEVVNKFIQLKEKFGFRKYLQVGKQTLGYTSDTDKLGQNDVNIEQQQAPIEQIQKQNENHKKFKYTKQMAGHKQRKLNGGFSLYLDEEIFKENDLQKVEVDVQVDEKQSRNKMKLKIKRKTQNRQEYIKNNRSIKNIDESFKKPQKKGKTCLGDVKKVFDQNGIKELYKEKQKYETDEDSEDFSVPRSSRSIIQPVHQSESQSFYSDIKKIYKLNSKINFKVPKKTRSLSRKSSGNNNDHQDSLFEGAQSESEKERNIPKENQNLEFENEKLTTSAEKKLLFSSQENDQQDTDNDEDERTRQSQPSQTNILRGQNISGHQPEQKEKEQPSMFSFGGKQAAITKTQVENYTYDKLQIQPSLFDNFQRNQEKPQIQLEVKQNQIVAKQEEQKIQSPPKILAQSPKIEQQQSNLIQNPFIANTQPKMTFDSLISQSGIGGLFQITNPIQQKTVQKSEKNPDQQFSTIQEQNKLTQQPKNSQNGIYNNDLFKGIFSQQSQPIVPQSQQTAHFGNTQQSQGQIDIEMEDNTQNNLNKQNQIFGLLQSSGSSSLFSNLLQPQKIQQPQSNQLFGNLIQNLNQNSQNNNQALSGNSFQNQFQQPNQQQQQLSSFFNTNTQNNNMNLLSNTCQSNPFDFQAKQQEIPQQSLLFGNQNMSQTSNYGSKGKNKKKNQKDRV